MSQTIPPGVVKEKTPKERLATKRKRKQQKVSRRINRR